MVTDIFGQVFEGLRSLNNDGKTRSGISIWIKFHGSIPLRRLAFGSSAKVLQAQLLAPDVIKVCR